MFSLEFLKWIYLTILEFFVAMCGCDIYFSFRLPEVARYPQKVANYHGSAALVVVHDSQVAKSRMRSIQKT